MCSAGRGCHRQVAVTMRASADTGSRPSSHPDGHLQLQVVLATNGRPRASPLVVRSAHQHRCTGWVICIFMCATQVPGETGALPDLPSATPLHLPYMQCNNAALLPDDARRHAQSIPTSITHVGSCSAPPIQTRPRINPPNQGHHPLHDMTLAPIARDF